ncbi:MAG: D-alanyl-D-alanine carboxypeptidase [Vicinamibacterales bacterium]
MLRSRVNEMLADPSLAAGTWGLEVRSLRTGERLVDVGAHRLLMPASTMKTVTLAVAADQLGWDFSFDTKLVPAGPISGGVLNGDLVIVGSADPSLDDWDGTASSVFASWAAQLKALGVRTITGRIVGDDRVVADSGFGRGWMWDDMAEDYSPPVSAQEVQR